MMPLQSMPYVLPLLIVTALAIVLAGLMIILGFFRFQLLDFGPVARDTIIESMRDGVLILDVQGRIVDLNPAAGQIIGYSVKQVVGQPAGQLLPDWPGLSECQRGATEMQTELVLSRPACQRESQPDNVLLAKSATKHTYNLRISPLYNWLNRLTGHVLLLSDITERVSAEKVLREAHHELERRVEERTAQLVQVNTALQAEIAERKKAEEKARRQTENLLAVNRLAIELAAASLDTDIFALIAETLKSITGAFATGVTAYDADTQELVLKYVAVENPALNRVNRLLGRNLIGLRTPVTPELFQRMLNEIVSETDSFFEITKGAIPQPVAAVIQRALKVASFTGLAFQYAGELMGTAVVVMTTGHPAPELELMQVFAHVAATSLRRKQAEDALRQSEERYRLHFENVHDVIYSLDPEFRVLSVSPAVERTLGYKPEELMGKSILELNLLAPDQLEIAIADARRILAGERINSAEYEFIAKDGTRKFGEVSGAPLILDGKVKAIISVARDITERKYAQEALIRASRLEATATLAGGMAHDINNLMTGVLGYAELLKMHLARQAKTTDELRHLLDMLDNIAGSAQLAGELAHKLLAFARGGKYQPVVMNLNDTIQGVVQAQKRALPAKIRVELDLEADLWRIKADPTQMEQVILSLFTNAVEAIPDSGHITLATRNLVIDKVSCQTNSDLPPGSYVYLSVQDTGSGISAESLPRLFEPFFTTKFQGRGLGLAAAYGIVDNHEGCIAVHSEVGQGTTFEVYLPALQTEVEDSLFVGQTDSLSGSETGER